MSVAMRTQWWLSAPYGVEPAMAVQSIGGFDPVARAPLLRGRAPHNARSSTDRTLLLSAPPRRGAPRRIAGRWSPMTSPPSSDPIELCTLILTVQHHHATSLLIT